MARRDPIYITIADEIRKEIISRPLPPHTRLPSEPELVQRYGAARETVRRALARLQDQGLVYSRQAVGSFVAEPRVEQDLDHLLGFTEFMVYQGLKPGSRVLTAQVQRISDPNSPVLRHLNLKPRSAVVYLRRIRLGAGTPLVIANTWLPERRFPGFLKHDVERHSVYEIMQQMGHRPIDAVQTIEAATLGEEDALLLTVPAGSAALLIKRIAYAGGIPVEYAVDYYRGDRTRFRVRLGVLEQTMIPG
ncbi:MAG: GntR family transcriptional regulator [Acidobacteria bacterium]|nr:GntR family transcriptional regulator [Acidobacteriota bacterium]